MIVFFIKSPWKPLIQNKELDMTVVAYGEKTDLTKQRLP